MNITEEIKRREELLQKEMNDYVDQISPKMKHGTALEKYNSIKTVWTICKLAHLELKIEELEQSKMDRIKHEVIDGILNRLNQE